MILQRTGNDLCGRGRTAVDEDDDRFALGEVASRYRHPRYARSDQKRARPKDSSESGGLRSKPSQALSEHAPLDHSSAAVDLRYERGGLRLRENGGFGRLSYFIEPAAVAYQTLANAKWRG
jgi:hypothetical protein